MEYPVRINKYLAEKGYATRKGADELVKNKKITINGRIAVLGDKVNKKDEVKVASLKDQKKYSYYAYSKPRGIVTTSAQGDEKSILDVAKFSEKVFPVGRIDKDSHGLIIMTDDGRITDRMLSPGREHEKEYIVEVDRRFDESFMKNMAGGVKIDGTMTKPAKVKRTGTKTFSIILTEGKNRQIRKMCAELNYTVRDLMRVRIMNITLGKLREGTHRPLSLKERTDLLKSLGLE
jgi:23S rRNA pseudouridine2604 synthase